MFDMIRRRTGISGAFHNFAIASTAC